MRDLIMRAAEIVLSGGVVAYPTDTYYGLACDPRSPLAVARLFALKERDGRRASPLIGASLAQVSAAVELNAAARRLAAAFWPGPLSLVLPARSAICPAVLGGLETAAVRVPADATARALAEAVGFCITATSANRSGAAPVTRVSELDQHLGDQLDFVLDGGTAPGGAASTIVDVTSAEPTLVRPGLIAWGRVLESLR
ncbi:MAG TPA: L-threonylcarbamoyladenylate synthase [Vicinamibacterales bacterium]|nr:L-threonylcarbamoyladenylate synthase [Vicinamibacterales bacterium]